MRYPFLFCMAFLAFSAPFLYGQKVTIIARYDSSALPLDKYGIIYVCQDDSLIQTIPSLMALGKILIKDKRSEKKGLDLYAATLKQIAKAWGANIVKVDAYKSSKGYEIMSASLFYGPKEYLETTFGLFNGKQLIFINPSFKWALELNLNNKTLLLPPHNYYCYTVETDTTSIRAGDGFMKIRDKISSNDSNRRFFKLIGNHLGIISPMIDVILFDPHTYTPVDLNGPEIIELDEFTGSIYEAVYTEYH